MTLFAQSISSFHLRCFIYENHILFYLAAHMHDLINIHAALPIFFEGAVPKYNAIPVPLATDETEQSTVPVTKRRGLSISTNANPMAFHAADIAKKKAQAALSPRKKSPYSWPGFESKVVNYSKCNELWGVISELENCRTIGYRDIFAGDRDSSAMVLSHIQEYPIIEDNVLESSYV